MATEQSLNHEGRISALEASYQHLATKADIESLRSEMRTMRWSLLVMVTLIVTVINVLVQLALRGA